MAHVLVMAKAPVPGRVKTRLCPPCTHGEAASIAAAALADTLAAVSACSADRRVLALDGPLLADVPGGIEVIPQRGDTFAERLANAWCEAGPVGVQIGMDTPQVTAALLDDLLDSLPVLALAEDGGWWALGLDGSDPHVMFSGIAMSTPDTGAAQAARLRALGVDFRVGPVLRDIDTWDDLCTVAASMPPASRLAQVVA